MGPALILCLISFLFKGFNYRFNALADGEGENELNRAFSTIFSSNMTFSVIPLLRATFPSLRPWLVSGQIYFCPIPLLKLKCFLICWQPGDRDTGSKQARATMERIGLELLEKSKKSLQTVEKVDKSTLKGRDILTLLLRANMATDLLEHQRMSDEEVVSRKSFPRCRANFITPLKMLI